MNMDTEGTAHEAWMSERRGEKTVRAQEAAMGGVKVESIAMGAVRGDQRKMMVERGEIDENARVEV